MQQQGQDGPIFKSIGFIVNSILNRLDKYDLTLPERLANILLEEYAEYKMYHINSVKVAYISLNDALIGQLPVDFVDYTKVGVNYMGEIRTLSLNTNLVKPRPGSCGETINAAGGAGPQFNSGGYYFADHFRNGQFIEAMFSAGGGYNLSYFNVDREKRIIWLTNPLPSNELIVEYISNGLEDSMETLVPQECVTPLRLYGIWQLAEYDDKMRLTDKDRREVQYGRAVENMRFFNSVPTMDEYLDSCYAAFQQGPKR